MVNICCGSPPESASAHSGVLHIRCGASSTGVLRDRCLYGAPVRRLGAKPFRLWVAWVAVGPAGGRWGGRSSAGATSRRLCHTSWRATSRRALLLAARLPPASARICAAPCFLATTDGLRRRGRHRIYAPTASALAAPLHDNARGPHHPPPPHPHAIISRRAP